MSQKNMLVEQEKYMNEDKKKEDLMNIQLRTQKEIQNEEQYRN